MNQTDTNKRIAEICKLGPFETFNNRGKQSKDGKFLRYKYCLSGGWYEWRPIPNYTESLDAIREAVLAQDQRFQNLFTSELDEMERINRTAVWKLTAADWCSAFLAVVEGRGE